MTGKSKKKDIGIKVATNKGKCEDTNCPFHGKLSLRGNIIMGTVVSAKAHKTATVQWGRRYKIPKYERFEKRSTKIKVHNPECIRAQKGDKVRIAETRPLSKTKNFVIIEKMGEDIEFKQKEEGIEESKVKETPEKPEEKETEHSEEAEKEPETKKDVSKEEGDE